MKRLLVVGALALAAAGASAGAGAGADQTTTTTTASQPPALRNGCAALYGQGEGRRTIRRVYSRRTISRTARARVRLVERCQHSWRAQRNVRAYRRTWEARWRAVCAPGQFAISGLASVFSDTTSGIATRYERGMWWRLRSPNGVVSLQIQSDWGPAEWTGRQFDLTASAASDHGYGYGSFPTDQGTWRAEMIGWRLPRGVSAGRQRACR